LSEKVVGPLSGFRSKMGRPFSAILKLTDEHKLEFDFGQSNEDGENAEPVDFGDQESLGACPKCGGRVFAHGMSYVCERSVGPGKSCDFRSGREILQQPIEPEQMRKLLAEGRTDLLTGFVSSRTRRKFKAFLVRQPDGRISFEFDNSKAKAAGAGKGAKAAGAGAVDGTGAANGPGRKSGATSPTEEDAAAAAQARPAGRKPAATKAPAKKAAGKRMAGKAPGKAAGKAAGKVAARKTPARKSA
jgi:DNA topoisomerase-3